MVVVRGQEGRRPIMVCSILVQSVTTVLRCRDICGWLFRRHSREVVQRGSYYYIVSKHASLILLPQNVNRHDVERHGPRLRGPLPVTIYCMCDKYHSISRRLRHVPKLSRGVEVTCKVECRVLGKIEDRN